MEVKGLPPPPPSPRRAGRQQPLPKPFRVDDYPQARSSPLFQPYQLGRLALKHRMVLAPLTRCRRAGGRAGAGVCIGPGARVALRSF